LDALQQSESPELRAHREKSNSFTSARATLTKSLPKAMYTVALETPRDVRILPGGNWLDESGELVEPAIPAFMGTLDTDSRATRLDLARWLVTPQSEGGIGELTARVLINRLWAMLHGTGLCPSLDDFGGQGQPPTNIELLDQLAIDLVQSGWDIKAMIRRMVATETYMRSSIPPSGAADADPENLFHARQSRFRLPAEAVRDGALHVSGLLLNTIGGPSVKPPQPPHYYRHLNFPKRTYMPDMGPEQWRRGVYVHWQRQFLHPMLLAFDAPTREDCTAMRTRSNTPTAALVLLNDPVFIEAARAFAIRILQEKSQSDRARIAHAMQMATSRSPGTAEIDILEALLQQSRADFAANPEDAVAHLGIGSSTVPDTIAPVELASWCQVTRAILNLHEMINRE
ncbi:MAG: DUF1553 domain-containing protein, partial [Phycisphaerales bacterium]|nr:DUF1553 domain-containing protein [Phycisphaerales bacterium]